MINGFSNNSQVSYSLTDSFTSSFNNEDNLESKQELVSSLKKELTDKQKEEISKLINALHLPPSSRDSQILSKFMALKPIEKIMLLLEIAMEIERRKSKGIKTPYFEDKSFTDMIKKEYGIDIYGSSIMDTISMLSPKALGITK